MNVCERQVNAEKGRKSEFRWFKMRFIPEIQAFYGSHSKGLPAG